MTLITATFLDSAGSPLPAGTTVTVTLDDPNIGATSVAYPVPRVFTVAGIDGKVTLDVPPTIDLTTRFVVALPGGTVLDDFRAIVPDSTTPVEFSTLVRRGIADSQLPSTLRSLLTEIRSDPTLKGLLTPLQNRGAYQPEAFYSPWDVVSYDGGSWVLRDDAPVTTGIVPSLAAGSPWSVLAQRGSSGSGTAGNPTEFDPVAWTNQGDAPSRGALASVILDRRNPIVASAPTLSPVSLDPLRVVPIGYLRENFVTRESPVFTGNPRCPTKGPGDGTDSIASCLHVKQSLDSRLSDLGTVLPTASDGRAISAAWARGVTHEFNYSGADTLSCAASAWTTFNLATVTVGRGLTMELGGVKVNASGFYAVGIEGDFTLGAVGVNHILYYALDLGAGVERGITPVHSGATPFANVLVPCSHSVVIFLSAGTLVKPKVYNLTASAAVSGTIRRVTLKQLL